VHIPDPVQDMKEGKLSSVRARAVVADAYRCLPALAGACRYLQVLGDNIILALELGKIKGKAVA